jgi:hypothetical protein
MATGSTISGSEATNCTVKPDLTLNAAKASAGDFGGIDSVFVGSAAAMQHEAVRQKKRKRDWRSHI